MNEEFEKQLHKDPEILFHLGFIVGRMQNEAVKEFLSEKGYFRQRQGEIVVELKKLAAIFMEA